MADYIETPDGGILLGGAVTERQGVRIVPSGGIRLGGEGTIQKNSNITPSGGIKFGTSRYSNGYYKRKKLTIAAQDQIIEKFPLGVYFFAQGATNGTTDWRFEDDSDNELRHEIANYVSSTGQTWAFVRVDLDTDEQEIYVYWR